MPTHGSYAHNNSRSVQGTISTVVRNGCAITVLFDGKCCKWIGTQTQTTDPATLPYTFERINSGRR